MPTRVINSSLTSSQSLRSLSVNICRVIDGLSLAASEPTYCRREYQVQITLTLYLKHLHEKSIVGSYFLYSPIISAFQLEFIVYYIYNLPCAICFLFGQSGFFVPLLAFLLYFLVLFSLVVVLGNTI